MAGFSVPTGALVVEFILLLYILTVSSLITMIAPIASYQNMDFTSDQFSNNYNKDQPNTFTKNGSLFNLTGVSYISGNWHNDETHGIYSEQTGINGISTLLNDKQASSIQLGTTQYNEDNSTQYNNFRLANINVGETDISFTNYQTMFVNNVCYWIVFSNGKCYLATTNSVLGVWYVSYQEMLSGKSIPSGIVDVKYTLHFPVNYGDEVFCLYLNGEPYGTTTLSNNIAYAGVIYNPIEYRTDNIGVNGFNLIDDGQNHKLIHQTTGSNSEFYGITLPTDISVDYDNSISVFFTVLLWNINGIPDWFNLLFIKIWLLLFFVILILIGVGLAVSWIP